MQELCKLSELKKHGATYIGGLTVNKPDSKIDVNQLMKSTNLYSTGFYFIVHKTKNQVASINHVGEQKKPRGFKEVLCRLNMPRTEQNEFLRNVIINSNRTLTYTSYGVYYMTYAQMNAFFESDEYTSKNNGLQMVSLFREKYNVPGRALS